MKWITRSSIFFLFFLLLFFVYLLDIKNHISLSMHTILPNSFAKDNLYKYEKINRVHEIIFATKGDANDKFDEYLKKIQETFESYSLIYPPKKEFIEYLEENKFYLSEIPNKLPNRHEIKQSLENLKINIREGFLVFADKDDPLKLFSVNQKQQILIPKIDGYEKTIFFTLDISSNEFEETYEKLQEIIKDDNDVFIYSTFFYFIENAKIFKSQVKIILGLSFFVLTFLYVYLLKNPLLFIFSITTLVSATLFSQIVASFVWNEISIYTLIFAGAVSTVSIDYMFHYYLHDAYGKKRQFLRPVFFGFITSFLAFLALFFIDFPLISQIAFTSAISLLFAYLTFAFVYPYMQIGDIKTKEIVFLNKNIIPIKYILIFSIVAVVLSPIWINFNYDLRALDVKNKNLFEKENLVKNSLHAENSTAIMIQAKTLDELIDKSKKIKNAYLPIQQLISKEEFEKKQKSIKSLDFESFRKSINQISKEVGFKDGFFKNSYSEKFLHVEKPSFSKEFLDKNNLKIEKDENAYYASGYINKNDILDSDEVIVIDSISLFEKEINRVAKELLYVGIFVFLLICGVIFYLAKDNFLRAFSFVLFPFAVCLLPFLFFEINILHIFMLIIVIAMSVDYAIYNACIAGNRTNEAIFYSLLSTIAGFGVLAFSNIYSLQAIGMVALCGTFATAFLIYFSKVKN